MIIYCKTKVYTAPEPNFVTQTLQVYSENDMICPSILMGTILTTQVTTSRRDDIIIIVVKEHLFFPFLFIFCSIYLFIYCM